MRELVNKPQNGPPLHRHVHDDEVWYVLEGDYRFKVGDAMFRVSEGGLAFGPRGACGFLFNEGMCRKGQKHDLPRRCIRLQLMCVDATSLLMRSIAVLKQRAESPACTLV